MCVVCINWQLGKLTAEEALSAAVEMQLVIQEPDSHLVEVENQALEAILKGE